MSDSMEQSGKSLGKPGVQVDLDLPLTPEMRVARINDQRRADGLPFLTDEERAALLKEFENETRLF